RTPQTLRSLPVPGTCAPVAGCCHSRLGSAARQPTCAYGDPPGRARTIRFTVVMFATMKPVSLIGLLACALASPTGADEPVSDVLGVWFGEHPALVAHSSAVLPSEGG